MARNNDARELGLDELNAVAGGTGQTRSAPNGTPQPANSDRRKSGLDNIQKILDIVHGMDPKI
jgi:hypothetical protein